MQELYKALEFYRRCWHELKLSHNLVHISRWSMRHLEEQKKNVEYLRYRSTDFRQVFTEIIVVWLVNYFL